MIAIAVLAFSLWAIWGPDPALAWGLLAPISVVIIACPCALGHATPMSIQVGVGKGATVGVLARSAEALERMEKVDLLVVDVNRRAKLTPDRRAILTLLGGCPGSA